MVTTGAGNPEKYMKMWKEAGVKIIPVIASVAHAKRMERCGADAVVAEGCESGGHIGETTTMVLVPQVVDAVNIPVIAGWWNRRRKRDCSSLHAWCKKPFRWELILWQPQSAGHIRITKI